MDRDNFMSPEEAKTFGVVDHVLNQTPVASDNQENKDGGDK